MQISPIFQKVPDMTSPKQMDIVGNAIVANEIYPFQKKIVCFLLESINLEI
jgi:hypothetical protein